MEGDVEEVNVDDSLAAEDEVGWDEQEDDPGIEALVADRSGTGYGSGDEDADVDVDGDPGVAPAVGGGAGGPAVPDLGAAPGEGGGDVGNAGGAGDALPHPAAAPVPPLDAGAAHGPDPWGGWFNASEDPTVGRLPKRDKPAHRFKTRNLDAASMPQLMEGSEFAIFRKLWSPEIVAMCVKHTNLRLAKLRAKDAKPVSYHQDITEKELWLWQGLTMVMGICRLPSVELYWSKQHYGEWEFFCGWPFISNTNLVFSSLTPPCPCPVPVTFPATAFFNFTEVGMSRNRYVTIKAQLAFVPDREVSDADKASPQFDRLWRIRPLLDALQERFQHFASPSVVITLDEMMVQMSGCVACPSFDPSVRGTSARNVGVVGLLLCGLQQAAFQS